MKPQNKTSTEKQNALIQEALFLQQSGFVNEAASQFKKLLKSFPDHPQLLTGLGLIATNQGDFAQAVKLLGKSLTINPAQEPALLNMGITLAILQRFDEAVTYFNRLIAINPNIAEAYGNRGNVYLSLNLIDDAILNFNRAILLKPEYPEAFYNLGNTLLNIGIAQQNFQLICDAINHFDRAIALKPNFAEAYNNRGNALSFIVRLDHAIASYDYAIILRPDFTDAYANRENALNEIARLDDAINNPDTNIQFKDSDSEAYINRGNYLHSIKQFEKSLACYNLAIQLKPDDAVAHYNHGLALHELHRLDEALISYDRSIALNPTMVEPFNNRGNVLKELQRLDEALQSYDQAIAVDPNYADAHWNKSLLKIKIGDFEEGWRIYEWRWKSPKNEAPRQLSQPLWLGETAITGKTILIHPEQGLGDFIQFCRYVSLLEAEGAQVILETPPPLLPLIRTLKGRLNIIAKGQPLPDFDVHCPVMSLPLAFKTTVKTIPAESAYLFATPEKRTLWQERLGEISRTRIGLVWSGSTTHKDDYKRSIPFKSFEPILAQPFEFHSLQKEYRLEDAHVINYLQLLRNHHTELNDFADTAALIDELDLVITVDTSVAHVAGAMGKQVWLLLAYSPDYRWLLDRNDTPWYPSMTLFRQPSIGDWNSVIAEVISRLTKLDTLEPKIVETVPAEIDAQPHTPKPKTKRKSAATAESPIEAESDTLKPKPNRVRKVTVKDNE